MSESEGAAAAKSLPVERHARDAADALEAVSRSVAEWTVDLHYAEDRSMECRYGPRGRKLWRGEVQNRLAHLAQAIAVDRAELFVAAALWSKDAFQARDVCARDLTRNLQCLQLVLARELPGCCTKRACGFIEEAVQRLPCAAVRAASPGEAVLMDSRGQLESQRLLLFLLERNRQPALALMRGLLDAKWQLGDIHARVIVPALSEIGRMWHSHEISVAEEHAATELLRTILTDLRLRAPQLESCGRSMLGMVVAGDLHNLGLRMVADLFELAGWRVDCFGADLPTEEAVAMVAHEPYDLIVIGASTTLVVRSLAELIEAIRATPGAARVPILVGGDPFRIVPDLWKIVGADGCGEIGTGIVALAEGLVR